MKGIHPSSSAHARGFFLLIVHICLVLGDRLQNGSPYAIGPCLSVTLVYCGQTVGWIKMKLSIRVGLDPGHVVLDGDPAPP